MSEQKFPCSLQACPRCHELFKCGAANIGVCQCNTISLSKEQLTFINQQYDTCLCINCLQVLQYDYEQQTALIIK
ncbi:cysteine-rich CWC family protein [Emticicia sp. BO119]|uniref:cysteine-rich CWC family protein n=1 Tax=Emticicia sp. BO119 TaxID=2757768 RepID=UPI0015F0EB43|nr:cysteine-rich CWC family protein [Emticicia sp. BO119]MBA4852797.1 cysteine-rich CWC family protein [Emticicia sp. BO119]